LAELASIVAPVNNKTDYYLPNIADPDGDAWRIDVSLGEAITFARFSGNNFTFDPK
jgi:hypothetical protein